MTKITKEKNILTNEKTNTSPVPKQDNDIFTFNIATENYNVFVNYENTKITSEEINFECTKPKLTIQNNFTNISILKSKTYFKVFLKNPKIDFKDNKSAFQVKMKNGFLVISISTPFKIIVNQDTLLFSSDISEYITLNPNFTDEQKAKISQMKDNKTLLISEYKNKTFLPYSINDICIKYDATKYSSIEDLIEKEYTVSNDYYKYPIFSRFKEGYKLVKEKENGTRLKAFNLGTELMFNFNLNPSIITACKNLEELNIYLDCLEENELHKFLCFDIIYEVSPTKL